MGTVVSTAVVELTALITCIREVAAASTFGRTVVACCRRCNMNKRDHLLAETSMRLTRSPTEPASGAWVAFAVSDVPMAWAPYLPETLTA